MTFTRRQLLQRSAAAAGGLLVAGPLRLASPAGAAPALPYLGGGFGPLQADPAGVLDLPAGFSYQIVSRAGTPLAGQPAGSILTPGRPDGTAAFATAQGTRLVQNHEQGATADFPVRAAADFTYDPGAVGGTTTLLLDPRTNRLVSEYVSLAGTFNNCAGGATPWGTWLTCEETEVKAGSGLTRDHGWVFEVDPENTENNRNPFPLTALGRFPHEAVVVDPTRGTLYLTEDASSPNGLLYRFTPSSRRWGYGTFRQPGRLEAMRIPGVPDLSVYTSVGTELAVQWVAVPDPSAASVSTRKQFSYFNYSTQATVAGPAGEITRSKKFEGAWWGRGKAFIVTSFAHGAVDWSAGNHDGQVWSYDPSRAVLRLEAYFPRNLDPSGAGSDQPDGPDNITVNPWGGLFVAEDGEGTQHLVAVDDGGRPSIFARNRVSGSEFTGVNFSPDIRTLFANIQDDGLVFAISGPFYVARIP